MLMRALLWLFALCFVSGYALSEYACVSQEFRGPIQITETAASPDGGSMVIDFTDASAKHWRFIRVGSLEIDPANQELFVIGWFSAVPFRCKAPVGSRLEKSVKQSIAQWKAGKLTAEQSQMLDSGDMQTFLATPKEVIAVWGFSNWLESRR